ncbi:MAG TPA: hypothetical protein VMS17_26140 [Gemmataceae bacterium]|nr:hypothetical protein [Gemmataceae bacterium]
MPWPTSQDYNEAIQSPAANFADADLQRGQPVVNALGLPMPYSGSFADVYQVCCPDGGRWAVKCFTREVPGLRDRYAEISKHLRRVKLPFMVDFTYLKKGIRVAGTWHPVLKMQWAAGLTLHQFLSRNADKPAVMETLLQAWVRTARQLRDAQVGHCDLQHGNVLLVRGADGNAPALKLIDYDGLWTPALADRKSGEVGHPSYQHPQRAREGIYCLEVDRFPLLLIAAALCALKAKGRALWEKYDDGDNVLFKQADLLAPTKSALFHELIHTADPLVAALADRMVEALRSGLEATPLLDEALPAVGPAPTAVETVDFNAPMPAVPDWLRELAAAQAAVGDLTRLPPPSADCWLEDVGRLEGVGRRRRRKPDAGNDG